VDAVAPSSPGTLLADLPGVGEARAARLKRLGLHTAKDVLLHFPRGYKDFTGTQAWAEMRAGLHAAVAGEVVDVSSRMTATGRSMTSLLVRCQGGSIRAVWFNLPFLAKKYAAGMRVVVAGVPRRKAGSWEFVHPDVRVLEGDEAAEGGEWLAVYPLTAGVQQSHVRVAVRAALDHVVDGLKEAFSAAVRSARGLVTIQEAFRGIHRPTGRQMLDAARRRLAYADHLIVQLLLREDRREKELRQAAPMLAIDSRLDARIRARFPFSFTPAQNQAVADIVRDVAATRPMHRLLQGEVGSGKTAVAVYAMLAAIANRPPEAGADDPCGRYQAALLAPTELLARQHHRSLARWLSDNNARNRTQVELLVGGMTPSQRRDVLGRIESGEAAVAIGTHALLSDSVRFHRLALVVIDEQQRFGVEQRLVMQSGKADPHTLIMTATPIPRTLAHGLYGDLDISEIRQQPAGRQAVSTYHVLPETLGQWWDFYGRKLRDGRRGYVVVPVIEDTERGVESIASAFEELANGPLEAFRLGLVHGRMPPALQNAVLEDFAAGKLDVLVATPVIEVGIDVPQATIMTILDADCFGLSQLHQLRGRVARGAVPGLCGVATGTLDDRARERIEAFVATADGFELAALDHRLRGGGRLFGTQQSGRTGTEFKFTQRRVAVPEEPHDESVPLIPFDEEAIIAEAREDAVALLDRDPQLALPEHVRLRDLVDQRRREQQSQGGHHGGVG
jgi:ATP-dependent DNA helicase RecG